MHKVAAALLVAVLLIGALVLLPGATPADLSTFPTLTNATLAGRTIVDFGTSPDGTVAYSYLGDPVPEVLAENEVPEMRSENSYTKFDGVVKEGEDPTLQLTSIIYSQPAYAKDIDGTWKYLEYATTTEQAFRDRDITIFQRIAEVFVRTAYADSIAPFSDSAGDGYVVFDESGNAGVLSSCTAAGSGSDTTNGITTALVLVFRNTNAPPGEGSCSVYRMYTPFYTGDIPTNSVVTAATLSVYVTAKTNGDTTGDGLDVVASTQASVSALANGDYPSVGASLYATTLETSTVTTGAYNVFTFNAQGMSAIKFSGQASCGGSVGYTCLALRESHDIGGAGLSNAATNSFTISTAEHTGTTQDPVMSITYSAVASVALPSGMKIGAYGSLKIVGGGIKIK